MVFGFNRPGFGTQFLWIFCFRGWHQASIDTDTMGILSPLYGSKINVGIPSPKKVLNEPRTSHNAYHEIPILSHWRHMNSLQVGVIATSEEALSLCTFHIKYPSSSKTLSAKAACPTIHFLLSENPSFFSVHRSQCYKPSSADHEQLVPRPIRDLPLQCSLDFHFKLPIFHAPKTFLTHSLTPSLTPSLPHSLPHSLTHSLTPSLTHRLPHACSYHPLHKSSNTP